MKTNEGKQNRQPGEKIETENILFGSVFDNKSMVLNVIKIRRIRRKIQNFYTNAFGKFDNLFRLMKSCIMGVLNKP
ncbi:hypothetical protein Wcon_01744 [Wolbachia endosymbiont of Cylisticus convexus]|nr:hypothetical protein Wcon_01744 [Wolbachia endosymbiont of Cylisticus convexus]